MGVGGTAMAAFAGMLQERGWSVTGSDKAVYPPMSDVLAALGIRVMEGYEARNLDHRPDLVIVGNVIRKVYAEAEALLSSDLPYCSFPEALGAFFLERAHSVVVAGTHGKTTTTALAAWLLDSAGRAPGFLIGGVARNFPHAARAGAGDVFVVEGDEYDTAFFDKGPKFLHYRARTAIITSVEFDHADIYADLDAYEAAFRRFVSTLPADGHLVVRADDEGARRVSEGARCRVSAYGPGSEWDGRTLSVDANTGTALIEVLRDGRPVLEARTCMVGTHNLMNQVAAVAALHPLGISFEDLARGIEGFQGIKRRQEVYAEPGGVTLVDDFAHHPTAVRVTLAALRERFGARRLWCVWEPRSATSRRNVFQEAYAAAFDDADRVVVARPFDTSGLPEDQRFSSDRLARDVCARGVHATALDDAAQIAAMLVEEARPRDVIAIFSNGGFGGLHARLATGLAERFA
jgi:UDP-N-acetylmuramate: L-alanyl-gamma-D-glutamyl-meso-diaminopimelate ligase